MPALKSDDTLKEFNDKLNKKGKSKIIKDLPMEGISLIGNKRGTVEEDGNEEDFV